jgi:transposase
MRKQKSAEAFGFSYHDRRRLGHALTAAMVSRVYVRLKAVLLVAEGMQVTEVAKLFDKSRCIIYSWIAAYLKAHRCDALQDAPRSGRPLSAPGITDKRILGELKRSPLKLGYNTNVWTVEVLARQLSLRYGCDIRPFTLYRRMKALGLRSKRPRYVYAEKDPHRAQKKGPSCES